MSRLVDYSIIHIRIVKKTPENIAWCMKNNLAHLMPLLVLGFKMSL